MVLNIFHSSKYLQVLNSQRTTTPTDVSIAVIIQPFKVTSLTDCAFVFLTANATLTIAAVRGSQVMALETELVGLNVF